MLRRPHSASRLVLASLVVGALVLWAPAAILAHSALESADPAANSTITESPTLIVGNFTEKIDPARSSMELRGPDGSVIAKGGVAPGDPEAVQMTITPPAPLAVGTYEVRWTTVTPDDNGIERGTYTITIAAAATAPATPVAPTASAGESAVASASAEASESAGSPEASAAESVAPSETASAAASPSDAGGSGSGSGGAGPDLLVVGGVAVVLLAVIVAAGVLVARSRRA